jgi:hypothetical protein
MNLLRTVLVTLTTSLLCLCLWAAPPVVVTRPAASHPGATSAMAESGEEGDVAASEPAETFESVFGDIIREAKAAPSKQHDLDVARELLRSSVDDSYDKSIQIQAARTAAEMASGVGTAQGDDVAERAIQQWAALLPSAGVDQAAALVTLRNNQLKVAPPEKRKDATGLLAKAVAGLGRAYAKAGDAEKAAAQFSRASGLAASVQMTDLASDYGNQAQQLQRSRSHKRELSAATQELAAAHAGNNPVEVKAAQERIGLYYLLREGDLASAAPPLALAGHAWAEPAALAAKWATGVSLTYDQTVAVADMLKAAAPRAVPEAKATLLQNLLDLLGQAKAQAVSGTSAYAKLDQMEKAARQMQSQLGESAELGKKVLAGLNVSAAVMPEGAVQMTYNFRAAKELEDFNVLQGTWAAGDASLTLREGDSGFIVHRLRLQAGKPIEVSFTAASPEAAMLVLCVNDRLEERKTNPHLGTDANLGKGWIVGGMDVPEKVDSHPLPKGPLKVIVRDDGKGHFTASVNGTDVTGLEIKTLPPDAILRVGFYVRPAGQSWISNLVIQGTPFAKDPVAAASPAATAAPGSATPAPIGTRQPNQPRPRPPVSVGR